MDRIDLAFGISPVTGKGGTIVIYEVLSNVGKIERRDGEIQRTKGVWVCEVESKNNDKYGFWRI